MGDVAEGVGFGSAWCLRCFGVLTAPSGRVAVMSRCVGVDLHAWESRVVVLDGDGVKVSSVNVDNREPDALVAAVSEGGEDRLGGLRLSSSDYEQRTALRCRSRETAIQCGPLLWHRAGVKRLPIS